MIKWWRVFNRFFGIRYFPYLNLGIRDFKAKSGGDSGLKVSLEVHASNVANDE